MNEMMKILLSLSLSGTVLIFILLILRPLYKERISKSWQYYIWLVVIARLLFPWALDISPARDTLQKTLWENGRDGTDIDIKEIVPDTIQDSLKEISARDATGPDNTREYAERRFIQYIQPLLDVIRLAMQNMHIIWLAIALLLFTHKVTAYQSFAKYVYASSIVVNDIDMLEHFGNIIEQSHIKSTVGLYVNDVISSPMLIGFFHPRIVVTTDVLLSETSFHYTVLHELAHYKRMDMLYKWLVQIVICLHWFNPFVYLMGRETSRSCELSCDEMVIKKLDAAAKREYGDTLLDAIHTGGSYKNISTSVTLNESKELLKGRLEAIMKYREKSRFTKVVTFILTILLCTSAAVINVYKTPAAVGINLKRGTSASTGSIIYENGTYYIMDKGASESDKPSGGVTDGSVAICLVQKDRYRTISPFSNMAKLVDEVKSQCKYAIEEGKSTQDEANIFINAAKEIQSAGKSRQKRFPKLNKESVTIKKGGTFSLKMTGAGEKAMWVSGDEKVATVDKNGKVSAKKAGKVKITAKIGKIIYPCRVRVTDKAAKKTYAKDYAKQGITKRGGAYYYKGKRIRIFMDVRADGSFVCFNYDKKGTDDLRIRRAENNSVIKVEYITRKEAGNILNDMDIVDSYTPDIKDTKPSAKVLRMTKKDTKLSVQVSRLTKKEVPGGVAKAINSCNSKKWYIISKNRCRYIYYNGLKHSYAFQPEITAGNIKISIFDIGSPDVSNILNENYVLLAVRQDMPLNIYYNNTQVSYKKIKADTKSV